MADKLETDSQMIGNRAMADNSQNPDVAIEAYEPTKADLSAELRDLLADVVTFKFLAHGAHWNVRGSNFSQFHEFFGDIYEDADSSIDPIAEAIRKLNFDAPFLLPDLTDPDEIRMAASSADAIELSKSLYKANESVRASIVSAISCASALAEQGIVNLLADRQDMHSKWQWQLRATVGDSFADMFEIDVEEVAEGVEPVELGESTEVNPAGAVADGDVEMSFGNSGRSKWDVATEKILARLEGGDESRAKGIETRMMTAEVELRAVEGGDGMTFEGYAARFNSPSEPIGGKFIEYIAPGAFQRSIKTRGYDVKLLWNHDTSQVLGSTRSGTLTLAEDGVGLKAVATLPDTQMGRDAATLIKRGDVAGMSFGFQIPAGGDSWSADGQTRTLNNIKLHEVSITPFPAYPATTASVRNEVRAIDADVLAVGLTRLEAGETLDQAQADAIREVVGKMTEQKTQDADIELFKQKLALQGKRI